MSKLKIQFQDVIGGKNLAFIVEEQSEDLRNTDTGKRLVFNASNGVKICSGVRPQVTGGLRREDEKWEVEVFIRGLNKDYDNDVQISEFDSTESRDKVISLIKDALKEFEASGFKYSETVDRTAEFDNFFNKKIGSLVESIFSDEKLECPCPKCTAKRAAEKEKAEAGGLEIEHKK